MKTYITRINGWSLRNKSHYMQHVTAEIAHQLGCREMGIYRYDADSERDESLSVRMDGIIAGINRGDLVICQFPTGNGGRFERELVNRLKAYGGRIAIYIHELEELVREEKKDRIRETVGLYNLAEVLIVQTYAMRNWLLEHGTQRNMKFVIQEMWDYPVCGPMIHIPSFKREICFTDNEGFVGMNSWNYAVPLKLYNVSVATGQNVQNLGGREPHQLLSELSGGGFGLVWYRDEHSRQYIGQSSSFSLARYLSAGIPVIIPAESSHRTMVEVNHLGLVVNTLGEAAAAVEKMTEGEYREYTKAVEQFASALRDGYYTKKCLIETMQAFCRKDAGRIPVPERVYEAEESAFRSASLKESYGGNLALSWDFQGEAEGFLIYDTAGNLQGETWDIHQHYLLLKGQEKEKGFLVKAYVETLRGKLVLAQSGPVYLEKKPYGDPKVSMVIPAYNAENYVARCIDTVLAQTQPDVEIVVVNDGSTDHTKEIIDWYAEKYANVVALYQENRGAATARNIGIEYANGEYIGFVDSDDMLRPDMIRRLYNSVKKNDCDIVATSVYRITNSGYERFLQYPMSEDIAVDTDEFFEMHFAKGVMFATVIWNKLYRASLVKTYLLPPLPLEDGAWTPYLLSYIDRICYLNDCSYEWDRIFRDNTLMNKLLSKSKEECFEMYKDTVIFYLNNGNPKRMNFLKMLAKRQLLELGRVYAYDAYERLWNQIEGIS